MQDSVVERCRLAVGDVTVNVSRMTCIELNELSGDDLDAIVRAVLHAIRLEPSQQSDSCPTDMVDAGRVALMEWEPEPDDFKRANAAVVDCWNAMIDAALSQSTAADG